MTLHTDRPTDPSGDSIRVTHRIEPNLYPFAMPSVYSRLTPYFTPQWFLLLVGSYFAYRLVRRWSVAAAARAQLKRLQEIKKVHKQADTARVVEAIKETEQERIQKADTIVTSSAVALVGKMASGQSTHTPHRVAASVRPRSHFHPSPPPPPPPLLCVGSYSARLVLHSILARCLAAQAQFNLLSETNFAQALDDAEKADKQSEQTTHTHQRTNTYIASAVAILVHVRIYIHLADVLLC